MLPTDVLIIDDSKTITKLTAKVLLSNKITNRFFHKDNIYIAYDGIEAIELLSKHPNISLVVSDIMMPELNGNELIEILIDTGRIKTLEVIFITTPINKKSISNKSLEYIKGVVYKPFSVESFSDFFDNLQKEYEEKIQNQKKIKTTHIRQMKYIRTWIQDYCVEEEIDIRIKILESFIKDEFNHSCVIDAHEIYMIYQIILENYIKSINSNFILNLLLAEKIYKTWLYPEIYKSLSINESFDEILQSSQSLANDALLKENIRLTLILPLNRLLTKTRDGAKVKQKLPYDDFIPFIDKLLSVFIEIDDKYQSIEVQSILNHIQEILKFQDALVLLTKEKNLIERLPILTEAEELTQSVIRHIHTCIKYIAQQIIPYYVFKANNTAWQKAKKSPKILNYLNNNLKFKVPNTHNLLYQRDVIDRTASKKFQKYEKEKVILITRDLEILEAFKKKLAHDVPSLEILIFKSASILKNELEKYEYKKIVIDLNFKDSVFENGFYIFKYLSKHLTEFEKIAKDGGLYFIPDISHKEMLEKIKTRYNYKIIKKPIESKKIFELFYLENS